MSVRKEIDEGTNAGSFVSHSCSSLAMVPCGCRRFVSVKMSVCVSFCCRLSGSHRYRSYVLSLVRRIYVRNRLTKSRRCWFASVSVSMLCQCRCRLLGTNGDGMLLSESVIGISCRNSFVGCCRNGLSASVVGIGRRD